MGFWLGRKVKVTAGSRDLPVAKHLPDRPAKELQLQAWGYHTVPAPGGLGDAPMVWGQCPHLKGTGREAWSCRCGVHGDRPSC